MKKKNLITTALAILVSLAILCGVIMALSLMNSPATIIVPAAFLVIGYLALIGSSRLLYSQVGSVTEDNGLDTNAFVFDNLVLDDDYYTTPITLLSGQANLARGALLGCQTISCPTTGTKNAGNTGAGTCTSVTPGINTKLGTYTLTCITAATGGGTFQVVDPMGASLPNAKVGTAFADPQLNFTLNASGADFIVGDSFTIAIAAGSGKYVLSLAASTDGSQAPCAILVKNTDATGGDTLTSAYTFGKFNTNGITFGTGQTAAGVMNALRVLGIFLGTSLSTAGQ